jgi:predicted GNAT superfamily acetyltransferase
MTQHPDIGPPVGAPLDDADTAHDAVEVRVLSHPADLRRLVVLFNQVWGTLTPIVGVELLRAMVHTGGYVAGAFSLNHLVGGSLGFLARHHGAIALHSHVTGILPGVRQTGLGRQMKLHQREWAANEGLEWVTWTFDPLVRRNAWFNISVLDADVDQYLVDFYGQMHDSINGSDPTDRLLVAWSTRGRLEPAPLVVPPGAVAVPTPEDIVVLRRTEPDEATTWRLRLREELGGALATGGRVIGFTRDGSYVVVPGS